MKHQTKNHQTDFSELYDNHGEYIARRKEGSFEQARTVLDVEAFKIPGLMSVMPANLSFRSVLEIGCATGELISRFPVSEPGQKVGCDISDENIRAARERYQNVEFVSGDFQKIPRNGFDCVILSDVLEHVEDDVNFLRKAAERGRYVLVNLPLEVNWLNWNRNYGINDQSGHLRKYSLEQGLELLRRSGLHIISYKQSWFFETPLFALQRQLRASYFGYTFSGSWVSRTLKAVGLKFIFSVPPLARRIFASNLFALAERVPEK